MTEDFLVQKRDAIVHDWFDRVVGTYPRETARFLKSERDRFNNPVGRTTLEALFELYDGLAAGEGPEALRGALDRVIRIRSVQDFSPSQAVAFVFMLKDAVAGQSAGLAMGGQAPGGRSFSAPEGDPDLRALDARIDRAALAAFDVYMGCREQLRGIRENEIERRCRFQRTDRPGEDQP
ncbi:MAG: RsbRD N-terminal domain-containing protein [Elusimicrobia bacterium]|nr:RsbRD N-terminal domain-containing protein [Elusimicrobiota bacterium]